MTGKFVDGASFFAPLAARLSVPALLGSAALALLPLPPLVRFWRRFPGFELDRQRLVWSATLTASILVSAYTPIYDTILVVLGAIWTADYLAARPSATAKGLPGGFKALIALVAIGAMVSSPLARISGLQIYTPALTALCLYQLRVTRGG